MTSRLAAVVVVLVSFGAATGALQSSVGQTADGQPIYEAGSGVTYPTLIRLEQPRYTDQARRARIGGSVELRAIILPDGTVGEIRVVKSLDRQYGLDEEAVAAARKWLFRPGTREGKPVAVIVTLILEFKLDGQPTAGSPPALQGTRIEPEDEFLKGTYAASTPGLVAPRAVKYSTPSTPPMPCAPRFKASSKWTSSSFRTARSAAPGLPSRSTKPSAWTRRRSSQREPGSLNPVF